MYVIHLIILLNILGVMIDNKRFALYCIMTITCCFTITKRKDDNSADFNDPRKIAFVTTFIVNFSNCQCGFYILEYKLTVNVHVCIRLTIQYNTNLLCSIMTPNILSRVIKLITYIWFHIDWFDWFYNKERKKDNITNE